MKTNKQDRIPTIKHLRDQTGCGLNEAKQALEDNNWSYEGALDQIRARGQDKLKKYSEREAKNGIIEAYIHTGNQLAVMVEVRCETDFSAKTPEFKKFAEQLAMHIAALHPLYLSRNDIPLDVWKQRANKISIHTEELPHLDTEIKKDHHIREKLARWYAEICLLDQRWIHDNSRSVGEVLGDVTTMLREKIEIARWKRWQVGDV